MNFVKLHQWRNGFPAMPVMVRASKIVTIEPYFEENNNGDVVSRSRVGVAFGCTELFSFTESVVEVLDLISEVEKNEK
jgi:hypothetical protein